MDLKHKQKKINSVIVKFNKEKHRDPLVEEIMSELDNKIELEIVQSFLLYNAKKDKKNHISIDIMSDDESTTSASTSKST
jgi:hypothetical protein